VRIRQTRSFESATLGSHCAGCGNRIRSTALPAQALASRCCQLLDSHFNRPREISATAPDSKGAIAWFGAYSGMPQITNERPWICAAAQAVSACGTRTASNDRDSYSSIAEQFNQHSSGFVSAAAVHAAGMHLRKTTLLPPSLLGIAGQRAHWHMHRNEVDPHRRPAPLLRTMDAPMVAVVWQEL